MWEMRMNAELSKSMKQMVNQAKESGDAPQAYFLFFESEKTLNAEMTWRESCLNEANAKLSCPERGLRFGSGLRRTGDRS
jgi:hypothetical protein